MRFWSFCIALLALVVIIGFALQLNAESKDLYISSCQKVGQNVVLSSDLVTSAKCLTVVNSNVVLDCNGHSITGPGISNSGDGRDVSIAIYGHGVSNITVTNCTFVGVDYGILLEDSNNAEFANNLAKDFFQSGIYFNGNGEVELLENNFLSPRVPNAVGAVISGQVNASVDANEFDKNLAITLSLRGPVHVKHTEKFNKNRAEAAEDVTFDLVPFILSKRDKRVEHSAQDKTTINSTRSTSSDSTNETPAITLPIIETNANTSNTAEINSSANSNETQINVSSNALINSTKEVNQTT